MNEVGANTRLSRHLAETEKYPGVRCLCNLHCLYNGFHTTVEKPMQKLRLQPTTTGVNSEMKQSESLPIIRNLLKAREKSRVQGANGFSIASHW